MPMRTSMRRSSDTPSLRFDHSALNFDSAAHGVNRAAELDECAIAGPLDDAPMMHADSWVDEVATKRPQPRKRAVPIGAREPAVVDHVGRQDRRKLPGLAHFSGTPALRMPSRMRSRWARKVGLSLGAPAQKRETVKVGLSVAPA